MAKKKLVFKVSASLATAGTVAAVAVSGCGISNPAPQNNDNVLINPAPGDLGTNPNDAGNNQNIVTNPAPGDLGFITADAGTDAGAEDAGAEDAGPSADAGTTDGGTSDDAGTSDAGPDGG